MSEEIEKIPTQNPTQNPTPALPEGEGGESPETIAINSEDLEAMELPALKVLAKEQGYSFPNNMGKPKLLELMKSPPTTTSSAPNPTPAPTPTLPEGEGVERTCFETSDGYQFLMKNDADNHARTLPEGERDIKEVGLSLET